MAAFDFPSSPSVNQTYTANGVTWKWNGTMWMRVSGAGYLEKIEEGNSKVEVDDSGSGNITATTDGTERFRITSAGRIGVNDSTPDATLSVGGSTAFIDIGAAGGNRGKIGYSSNDLYFGTSSSSGAFIFKTNVTSTDNPASSGTDRIRIDSNGRQYHYTDGSLRMHLNATGLGVNTSTITGGRIIHAHNTGTGSAYFQSTNSNTGEGSNSGALYGVCLLYTSPSPRDATLSRMPSSA